MPWVSRCPTLLPESLGQIQVMEWWGKLLTIFEDKVPDLLCSGKRKHQDCLLCLVPAKLKLVMFLLLDAAIIYS